MKSTALLSSAHWEDKRQWTEIINLRKFHLNRNKHFFFLLLDQTVKNMEQVAQRHCRVSICGNIQNPTGHSAGQPALADPV